MRFFYQEEFEAGSTIFEQGQMGDKLYIIKQENS